MHLLNVLLSTEVLIIAHSRRSGFVMMRLGVVICPPLEQLPRLPHAEFRLFAPRIFRHSALVGMLNEL